jgi:O-antigen ligase
LRKAFNHPVFQERWEQVTRAALALIFYLPESLWPYLPFLGTAVFTGVGIPLPAGLWLVWGLLATLRAAGWAGLGYFLREALVIFTAISCGSFLRRQARAGRQPLGMGFFSLILLPMVVLGLFQAAAGPLAPPSWLDPQQRRVVPFRITGTLDNPNLFGMVLSFIFPLLLAAIERTERGMGRRRLFYIFACLLHAAALLFTFSRTAWLAAVTALLVFQGREWKPLLLRLAILFFFVFLVFPPLRARLFPPGGLWQDSTVAYRWQIWETSWELFKANPLGTGSGGFRRAFSQRRFPTLHAHNQLLHIGVEQGIPGVLLFCCVAYLGLSGPVKTTGQRGARAALCGQLAAGLTETPWADPLLLFLFWCGWAYLREAADG